MSVDEIKRNKNNMTKLLVSLSISQREGMAEVSSRLGMSQQSLVRSAVSAFLLANAPAERAPEARRGRKPKDIIVENMRENYEPTPETRKPRGKKASA